jgi:hypothetical protein
MVISRAQMPFQISKERLKKKKKKKKKKDETRKSNLVRHKRNKR